MKLTVLTDDATLHQDLLFLETIIAENLLSDLLHGGITKLHALLDQNDDLIKKNPKFKEIIQQGTQVPTSLLDGKKPTIVWWISLFDVFQIPNEQRKDLLQTTLEKIKPQINVDIEDPELRAHKREQQHQRHQDRAQGQRRRNRGVTNDEVDRILNQLARAERRQQRQRNESIEDVQELESIVYEATGQSLRKMGKQALTGLGRGTINKLHGALDFIDSPQREEKSIAKIRAANNERIASMAVKAMIEVTKVNLENATKTKDADGIRRHMATLGLEDEPVMAEVVPQEELEERSAASEVGTKIWKLKRMMFGIRDRNKKIEFKRQLNELEMKLQKMGYRLEWEEGTLTNPHGKNPPKLVKLEPGESGNVVDAGVATAGDM